ncbi:hypothetical protein FRN98_24640 [Escherichia coli]|nr:hypothetical protein [Escherichia coli]EJQ5562209.1 hypothetical protein [Escherichia coli]ELW7705911.1 hypothetical protein [Escherichia coli]
MWKIFSAIFVILYSTAASADECTVIEERLVINLGHISLGAMEQKSYNGSNYFSLQRNLSFTASCNEGDTIEISYLAPNDGRLFSLNKDAGNYFFSIDNFTVNGTQEDLLYEDDKQKASIITPDKKIVFHRNRKDNKRIDLSLHLKANIFLATPYRFHSNGELASSGTFVIKSY